MGMILDASAALAWLINRSDPVEAEHADAILRALRESDAVVPSLWYPEVWNGILVAERRGVVRPVTSGTFLDLLSGLSVREDEMRPAQVQEAVPGTARTYGLTGYDAMYLELVLRTGLPLATFDRKLAEAVRKAGGRVFGDAV